jgi:hypothetical protein
MAPLPWFWLQQYKAFYNLKFRIKRLSPFYSSEYLTLRIVSFFSFFALRECLRYSKNQPEKNPSPKMTKNKIKDLPANFKPKRLISIGALFWMMKIMANRAIMP